MDIVQKGSRWLLLAVFTLSSKGLRLLVMSGPWMWGPDLLLGSKPWATVHLS